MQRVRGVKHNFQQYFSNVVAVSFIGGGNTHVSGKKNIPRYPIIVSRYIFFLPETSVDTEMCCPKGKCGCQYFILLTLKKNHEHRAPGFF